MSRPSALAPRSIADLRRRLVEPVRSRGPLRAVVDSVEHRRWWHTVLLECGHTVTREMVGARACCEDCR